MNKEQRDKAEELYIQDIRNDILQWAKDGNIPEIDWFVRQHVAPDRLDDETLEGIISHHQNPEH